MKKLLTVAGLALGLLTSLGGAAQARQTQTAPQSDAPSAEQQQRRMGRRGFRGDRMGRRGGGHRLHGLRQLNLSDAQRQQIHTIRENTFERTRAQREELHQIFQQRRQGGTLTPEQEARARQLHDELQATRERVNTEILGVLTPEQRTQLEQQREQHKERRKERLERRRDLTPDEQQ